jgi:hypothetical protein
MKTIIKFAAAVTLAAGFAVGLSATSEAQTTALGATIFGAGPAWGGPNVPFQPPFVGSEYGAAYGYSGLGYGAYGAYGAYGSALDAYGAAQDTWTGGDFNTGCETSGVQYGALNDYGACAGN